ncbi:2-oxoglutarate ferredoxin oxidoreductase subunit beta [Candidatus Uzinura diaspidicola str. ASNER]|uniref:2-oxoglutarate ferredoxin oxidoreductase subunit beta n=1 Tax=Candidatus Uzinura diaspidicola str. ASNER TaxID=1133592 RepID=L7VFX4_9FLAO|nr:2-oxoglutarate ferredoxin oxidoreductase subunit beta [Candidatus Uzinura diaspidicola str. ASNER]
MFKKNTLSSNKEIKWCPSCGNYSILKQVQVILPEIGILKENIVFVSGIGCSSRFPYYINNFGLHGIHGRAPSIGTGIKLANPKLSVWIITGDGDSFSIGGNHIIHLFRRNINMNVLLFNNEIYGLTKGQYSPTSRLGLITKSSNIGTIDPPFNTLSLALGAGASFVARSMDKYPKHLREILLKASLHNGTSFIEIYQNCNIFNDKAFNIFKEKKDHTIFLHHKKPLIFGDKNQWGIRLDGLQPEIVSLDSSMDLWIHDEKDRTKAGLLARFFDDYFVHNKFPRPFGILYRKDLPTYDSLFHEHISFKENIFKRLELILKGNDTWEIK